MGKLTAGDRAPRFTLEDQDGRKVSSADFKGRKLLVFFYPEADTPGCTVQACAARDAHLALTRRGVAVVGISPDTPGKQKEFDAKFSFGYPLLADAGHRVAARYGVWAEKVMFGNRFMGIVRSSFLIGEDGRVLRAWYRVSPEAMIPKALEALA